MPVARKRRPIAVPPPPGSGCPLSPCIRLLAGAWSLEIIYFVRDGPLRFGQIRRSLTGISSKVLTTRLRQLEERGVVRRTVLPANPPMVEYGLTHLGRQLLPILNAMSRVGARIMARPKARSTA